MALIQLQGHDIQFDPEAFDPQSLSAIASEFSARSVNQVFGADMLGTDDDDVPMPSYTYGEAVAEVRRQVEAGTFMPDLLAEATAEEGAAPNIGAVFAEMDTVLMPSLEKGVLPAAAIRVAEESVGYAKLIELPDGRMELQLDGEPVLNFGLQGALGASLNVIAAVVVVVIDLIFVALAVIGVATEKDPSFKKTVKKIVDKFGEKFLKLTQKLLSAVAGALRSYVGKSSKSEKKKALKDSIKDFAKGIFAALKYGYDHVWDLLKDMVKSYFNSAYRAFKAMCSLAVTVLGAIGSAGASLAAALINLLVKLLDLAEDCIALDKAIKAG
jgi:hypothetical protein